MSGVWVFKNGVVKRRLADHGAEQQPAGAAEEGPRTKALVYAPADEGVASHEDLQRRLLELGWERHRDDGDEDHDPGLVQFRRGGCGGGSADLIALPVDFAGVTSVHMHDVAVKNPDHFEVVDVIVDVDVRPAAE